MKKYNVVVYYEGAICFDVDARDEVEAIRVGEDYFSNQIGYEEIAENLREVIVDLDSKKSE